MSKKWWLISVCLVGVVSAGIFITKSNQEATLPSSIQSKLNFTAYLPSKLPEGYNLDKEALKYQAGILLVEFKNEDQVIFMSQQATGDSKPHIQSLRGFSKLSVPIGDAVAGEQEGVTAVIVQARNSLVTLTSETASKEILSLVAKRLEQAD